MRLSCAAAYQSWFHAHRLPQTTMFIDVPWDGATNTFGFPGTLKVKLDVAEYFTSGGPPHTMLQPTGDTSSQ